MRIAVEASGVHLLDTSLRLGSRGRCRDPFYPRSPGARWQVSSTGSDGVSTARGWDGEWSPTSARSPGGYAEQAVTAPDEPLPGAGPGLLHSNT